MAPMREVFVKIKSREDLNSYLNHHCFLNNSPSSMLWHVTCSTDHHHLSFLIGHLLSSRQILLGHTVLCLALSSGNITYFHSLSSLKRPPPLILSTYFSSLAAALNRRFGAVWRWHWHNSNVHSDVSLNVWMSKKNQKTFTVKTNKNSFSKL